MRVFERLRAAVCKQFCHGKPAKKKHQACYSYATLLLLVTLFALGVPYGARADVTYTYTGNPFDVTLCHSFASSLAASGDRSEIICPSGNAVASFTFGDAIKNFTGSVNNFLVKNPPIPLISFKASALGITFD